jgi:hypoxanthine phosphoribosyltransferase
LENILKKIKVLIKEEEINKRIKDLSILINEFYIKKKQPVLIIGVLKSCFPFFSELLKQIKFNCIIDFIKISSFQGKMESFDDPKIIDFPNELIENHEVLIVEDIVDSGKTIKLIKDFFLNKKPLSLKIVSLLIKKKVRNFKIIDWFGFQIDNFFIVGYGLDYQEQLRNLPFIGYINQKDEGK